MLLLLLASTLAGLIGIAVVLANDLGTWWLVATVSHTAVSCKLLIICKMIDRWQRRYLCVRCGDFLRRDDEVRVLGNRKMHAACHAPVFFRQVGAKFVK